MNDKNKWNAGLRFEHHAEVAFTISTNRCFNDLTTEDILTALEMRLNRFKVAGDEVLEMVTLIETVDYDGDE